MPDNENINKANASGASTNDIYGTHANPEANAIDSFTDDGSKKILVDRGVSGLARFGGFVHEEFDTKLQGRKGMMTYREMRDNDATVGAILTTYDNILRQLEWTVESTGAKPIDDEAKQFLESCMHDMSISWNDIIAEILTFLPFGFSYMEDCWKIRNKKNSKYPDGRVSWSHWGIRAQETLWRWRFGPHGEIMGMEQIAAPDFKNRFIPIERALLFRTKSNKNNPEGRSFLRNAYRSWYFKKNFEDIEAIGIERDIGGIPYALIPSEIMAQGNPDDVQTFNQYKKIVNNLKVNQQSSIVAPSDRDDQGHLKFEIGMLQNNSRKLYDINAVINRLDNNICRSVLAEFLMLGDNSGGSYALSKDKTDLFKLSLKTIANQILDVINDVAIPRLFSMNTFDGLTEYPKMKYSSIDDIDLDSLGRYIKNLFDAGILDTTDPELENYLRDAADLPKRQDFEHTPKIKTKQTDKNELDNKLTGKNKDSNLGGA